MHPFPELPTVADAPALSGHLWIQELVVGAPLRVRLEPSGTLTFADERRPLADPPPSLRAAVDHLERALDREALLDAAGGADPSGVVLYGVATRFEGVDYDWARLPPFLGTDVYSAARGDYLPPDVVERTFERLGLTPVDALRKEVDARDVDPASYEVPASAWYDGPAAGVVFRTKTGDRAVLRNPDVGGDDVDADEEPSGADRSSEADPAALARQLVTPDRVQRAVATLDAPDFDAVFEATLAAVAREEHARLPPAAEGRAFRTAVAERVGELWG